MVVFAKGEAVISRLRVVLVAWLAAVVALPAVVAAPAVAAAFVHLSDLVPSNDPPPNGWGPYERDMSNGELAAGDGGVLTLNSVTYSKGLGVHADSDIRYDLTATAEPCATFLSAIGIDDEVGSNGNVSFQVYTDGVLQFSSGTMTGSSATQAVNVDVTGRSELRLVVDRNDGSINSDHADWADAKLECQDPPGGSDWTVTSPSGAISMTVELAGGALQYSVTRSGSPVLQDSDLGIQRTDTSFDSGLTLVTASPPVPIDDVYNLPHGKTSQLHDQASERTLEFANTAGKRIQIIFRAYDDGVAFRYRFPETDNATFTVNDEYTTFNLASDGRALLQPRWPESLHDLTTISSPNPGDGGGYALPALFESGAHWVMLAESDADESFFAAQLRKVGGGLEYGVKLPDNNYGTREPSWTLPWEMPWRVVIVGSDVEGIIESNLVSHLADPSQITDTSWIQPGRVSWHWWTGAGVGDMNALESYVDFAAAMGWEYSLIDADWDDHHSDADMQALVNYAAAQGVGIFLWYNSAGPQNSAPFSPRDKMWDPAIRQAEFAKLASWGVAGVKVDFFESEKQIMIEHYLGILEDAAAEEIMVLFHGSTTPRGWYRTWPNMLTTEAVRGAEYYKFESTFPADAPLHNVEAAFSRNVVGPMDYTPVTFSDNTYPHITTNAHELALSVVYESGLVHLADSIASYQAQPQPVQDFLQQVPAAWDEIRFLEGDPASHIVLARREGVDWYIGGINGSGSAIPVTVDLAQFGYGGSGGTLIADGATDRTFVNSALTGTTLNVTMSARGGFVARLPATTPPADFTIMPVGDSVTEGNNTWHTYRCYLWLDLAPHNVDFVGTLSGTYDTVSGTHTGASGCPWSLDADHEAYWGERTDEVGPKAAAAAITLQPDFVLAHLGTNDVLQGQANSQTKEEQRQLIADLRTARSDVAVLLAQPIPCDPTAGNPQFGTKCSVDVPDLGTRLYELAWEEDTPQSPVVVVDQHSNLSLADLRDGVHPDDGGDDKMADAWLTGLEPLLDGIDPAGPVSVSGQEGTVISWSPTHSLVGGRPLACSVVPGSGSGATRASAASCTSGSFDATGLAPGGYTFVYEATDAGVTGNGSATHFGEVTVTVIAAGAMVDILPGDDIQALVDSNPPGTTFHLRRGVYRMQQVVPKDGQVFVGEPGTILNGSQVLTDWIKNGTRWYVTGQTQEGAPHGQCDSGYERCSQPEQLFIDDVTLRHVTSLGDLGLGSWYFDYPADRIYIGEDPAGKVVETAVTPKAFFGAVDGVQIRNLVVEKYANSAQEGAIDSRTGFAGTKGLNWIVDGVEARLNHGSGIHVADGGQILNSYAHHNGQQGVSGRGTTLLIADNEIAFNNTARFSLDWEAGGNKFVGTNLTLRDNYSHDNYGTGIWIDIDSVDGLIEGNVVEDNFRAGIFFEVSDTATIRNNYTEGNGLDDQRAADWLWSSGILIGSSGNAEVYGNTVVNNGNGITATQQDRGAGRLVEDLNVHDNTVTMAPDTVSPFTNSRTGAVQDIGDDAIFTSRNNNFQNNTYRADAAGLHFDWNNAARTFAQWQSLGLDTSGSISPITSTPPTWSSSLTAVASTPRSIALTWSGASDSDGIGAYRVYEATLGRVATTAGATGVTVRFLDPGTTYGFTVEAIDVMGNESTGGPSVVASTGSPVFDTTFAVFGDYGDESAAEADVAALVHDLLPDWIATTGDNFYGSGTYDDKVGQFYSRYLGAYPGSYGAGAPVNRFFPAIGNHDYSDPPGIADYLSFFTLPGAGIPTSNTSGNERYYDFVQGPVHVFVVNSDGNEPDGITQSSTQAQWLQQQLAASTAPWQIVTLHHAPYSSSSNHGSNPTLQWPFGPWGADAVFAGHDHTYERLDVAGTPYFVTGLGGRSIYGFDLALPETDFRYNNDYGTVLARACEVGMEFEFFSVSGGRIDDFAVGAVCGTAFPPPLPPSALDASAASATEIDLAWNDNAATETGFEIEVSTSGIEGPWSGAGTASVDVTAFSQTGLQPDSDYCYWVRASNGNGTSPWTNVACTTTPPDTTPPVITLNPPNPVTVEAGLEAYVEPGAIVTDDVDPSPGLVVDASAVNESTPGSYQVEYTATDAAGNSAQVFRTVDVVDTTAPVLVLNGENPLSWPLSAPFIDPGADVTDNVDPSSTVVSPDAVDVNSPGSYFLGYDFVDAAGNAASTLTREVVVVPTAEPSGDVLLQHSGSGLVALWELNATGGFVSATVVSNPGSAVWQVVGTGDFIT